MLTPERQELEATRRVLRRLYQERALLDQRVRAAERHVVEASQRYHEAIGDLPRARKEEDLS